MATQTSFLGRDSIFIPWFILKSEKATYRAVVFHLLSVPILERVVGLEEVNRGAVRQAV